MTTTVIHKNGKEWDNSVLNGEVTTVTEDFGIVEEKDSVGPLRQRRETKKEEDDKERWRTTKEMIVTPEGVVRNDNTT